MYKNSFLCSCKKTINPLFTKTNRVRPTVTCNTKFELDRMHHLDPIVFTHMHTHAFIRHRKNNINEFRRPENVCENLKVEFFHNYSTFLT